MSAPRAVAAIVAAVALVLGACGGEDPPPRLGTTMGLTSPAFENGGLLPTQFTCDGEDVAPPLVWTTGPENTVSYAIVMSDPDADSFIHWLVWDIPADTQTLGESEAEAIGVTGTNGFGDTGYGGPCPPEGDDPHRYRFTVYALSVIPDLTEGASWDELLEFIDDFASAEGTIEALYGR